MGRFRHGPESTRTRDRALDLPSAPSLSPSRGTSPATGSLADRLSRTWPFSPPAGPSSAVDSRSGYGGRVAASGRCLPRRASRGSCPSGTTRRSAPRLPSRSACACTRHALRSSHMRCSRIPAAGSARTLSAVSSSVAYAGGLLVLGVLPALVYDRQAQGCNQCPSNLLAISDRDALWTDLNRVGVYLGVAWALGLTALALVKLARASVWARAVFAAGASYLGLVAAWFASSLDRGGSRNGAARSDVSGWPKPRLSSFSPLESHGAGFGAAGHDQPSRSSSSISPSRLHPAA